MVLHTFGPSDSSKSLGIIERRNGLLEDMLRNDTKEWDLTYESSIYALNARIKIESLLGAILF